MKTNKSVPHIILTEEPLSKKVSKGVLWVTAGAICTKGLYFACSIVLARLLEPEDFGLMAVAMAIVTFSQGTTQTGFESALIQKQDNPEDYLNTAWTFELSRYAILFILFFFAAPVIAIFFTEQKAVPILRVISLTMLFQGLRNIGVVYFRKNLDFKKQFILEVVPVLLNICIVIPLAFILRNVWALVWASLSASVGTCCISYLMHPYRPRVDFNIKKAKNLFNFGKWILGASIVVMIREQAMTMFVGKSLGMTGLGFFNRAGLFSITIFQQLTGVVWNVGYPTYSRLQNDPGRFKQVYLKTLQLLSFLGIPLAGSILVLCEDFVHVFLTDKWLPIVPLMRIMCLIAIFNFINTPSDIAFQAVGRPGIGTKISLLGVCILAVTVYPLTVQWGARGTVASLFLSTLLTSPLVWYMGKSMMKYTWLEFFKPVFFSIISTAAMAILIILIKEHILHHVGIVGFSGLLITGIIIYIISTFLIDKMYNYGIYSLIMKSLSDLR